MSPAPERELSQPVFIVTAARSGSTLLRFILDSHPDFACPPETDIARACAYLASAWNVAGTAAAGRGGAAPGGAADVLPAQAPAALREAADAVLGHYRRSTGKPRVCDKSLSTVYYLGLMAQVYPEAKFICLYRHCMDVIASYVAAMPWGLNPAVTAQPEVLPMHGHVARNPGNSVGAAAEYWLDCAQRAAEFERAHPSRCHRVRYEDLVADPEGITAGVLSFLGAAPAPGLTDACFRAAHDPGPSDYKIWHTSGIRKDLVGSGAVVPAGRLPGPARAGVNELLAALGYRIVDEQWNAAGPGQDPRDPAALLPVR